MVLEPLSLAKITQEPSIKDWDANNVIPEKEVIDVELYEMLQRDLESLRNALQMKEVIITEKDANVEVLD